VGQSKTVEVRILINFHRTVATIRLFLRDKFHQEIVRDPPAGALNKGGVGKTSHFLALNVNILKMVRGSPKLLLLTNMRLMRFRLTRSWMTFTC